MVRGTGMVLRAHSSQEWMWMSVPQTDARFTRIRTSLIPISGTGTSSIHNPGSANFFTRAFRGVSSSYGNEWQKDVPATHKGVAAAIIASAFSRDQERRIDYK